DLFCGELPRRFISANFWGDLLVIEYRRPAAHRRVAGHARRPWGTTPPLVSLKRAWLEPHQVAALVHALQPHIGPILAEPVGRGGRPPLCPFVAGGLERRVDRLLALGQGPIKRALGRAKGNDRAKRR